MAYPLLNLEQGSKEPHNPLSKEAVVKYRAPFQLLKETLLPGLLALAWGMFVLTHTLHAYKSL